MNKTHKLGEHAGIDIERVKRLAEKVFHLVQADDLECACALFKAVAQVTNDTKEAAMIGYVIGEMIAEKENPVEAMIDELMSHVVGVEIRTVSAKEMRDRNKN